ncbi:MAG: hypothetical protein M3Q07_07865 [Pseudobdellovibrionaceae bacterium]|nr:hypothetical protein [Pseudobdellovibrionaceae bacterium]
MYVQIPATGWCLLGILSAATPAAGQVTLTRTAPLKAKATIELSSSSIQRGYTLIDGPALHPSVWVFTSFGVGIGAWGAAPLERRDGTNPVFHEQQQGEFVKIDTYLAYKFPQTEIVNFDMILAQYYYPQENRLENPMLRTLSAKRPSLCSLNHFSR